MVIFNDQSTSMTQLAASPSSTGPSSSIRTWRRCKMQVTPCRRPMRCGTAVWCWASGSSVDAGQGGTWCEAGGRLSWALARGTWIQSTCNALDDLNASAACWACVSQHCSPATGAQLSSPTCLTSCQHCSTTSSSTIPGKICQYTCLHQSNFTCL